MSLKWCVSIVPMTIIITMGFLITINNSVYARENTTVNLDVYLRLDKLVYYTDEQINLRICVKNRTDEKAVFDIYDKISDINTDYITFQPVVYDMKGKEAELIIPYKMENKDPRDLVKDFEKRTVTLGPGEEIIRSINLKKVYNLDGGKRYRVKGYFFPHFDQDYVIHSDNEITFRIYGKKREEIQSGIVTKYHRKADSPEMLPSEVVFLVLNGEKTKSLHRFIKYFNIEKYINAYPNYVRKYQRAFDEKKSKIEDEFITFLIRNRPDYVIDFRIKREDIDANNGVAYVDSYVERFAPKKSFRYLYRYTLEKTNLNKTSAWLITNIDVTVVKGEMK